MYVHASRELVYLANPRTASRATAEALVRVGFGMVGSHHSGLADPDIEERDRMRYLTYTSFTTVRDLRETLQSWARKLDIHQGNPQAGDVRDVCCEVLEHMDRTNQRGIIPIWKLNTWTLFPHALLADRLLHYATLEVDLNDLLLEHDLGPVELERIE